MAKVHVELGNHPLEAVDNDAIYRKLEDGDMSGSYWPEAVTRRLLKHDPEIVVIDGLDYGRHWYTPAEQDLTPNVRGWIRREQVRVRAYMPANLPELLDRDVVMIGGDAGGLGEITEAQDNNEGLSMLLRFASTLGASASVGVVLELLHRKHYSIQRKALLESDEAIDPLITLADHYEVPRYTRRGIIGSSVSLGILAGLASISAPSLTADTDSGYFDWMNAPARWSERIGVDSSFRQWIDGRSALLIQKAIEISKAEDASVCVVMGSGHFRFSELYLNDTNARLGAVDALASLTARLYRETSEAYTGKTLPDRMAHVQGLIGKYSVFTIAPHTTTGVQPVEVRSSEICSDIVDKYVSLPIVLPKSQPR